MFENNIVSTMKLNLIEKIDKNEIENFISHKVDISQVDDVEERIMNYIDGE